MPSRALSVEESAASCGSTYATNRGGLLAEEDGGAKISVYVPAKGAAAIADDDVTLLWDDTSVVLRFWHQGHKRQLDLPGRKGPFIRTRGRMDCTHRQVLKKTSVLLVAVVVRSNST